MVRTSPELRRTVRVYKDNLSIDGTASKYEPLGADADTLDGLNIHGALVDELHAHRTRAVWDVLETATAARRQPLVFAITTAGVERESICFEQHDYSLKLLDGALEDDTYFCFIASVDEGDDWTDPEVWERANPNLNVSVKRDDLERKCAKAINVPAAQNAFRRLHLNEWVESYTRWIDAEVWRACGDPVDEAALAGKPCYAGLDLAATTDICALALVFPNDDGPSDIVMRFWVPEEQMQQRVKRDRVPYDVWARQGLITLTPGNVVDYAFIRHEINELGNRFGIQEIAFDPWNAIGLATQLGEQDGFQMVQMRQGFASLSGATKELEARILGRKLKHGNNPVLTWMMSNVALQMDAAGNVKINKAKSTERVDGVAALVMATARAMVQVVRPEPQIRAL